MTTKQFLDILEIFGIPTDIDACEDGILLTFDTQESLLVPSIDFDDM